MALPHALNCTDSEGAPVLLESVSENVTGVVLVTNTVCDALSDAVTPLPAAEGATNTEPLKPLLGITLIVNVLVPVVNDVNGMMPSEKGSITVYGADAEPVLLFPSVVVKRMFPVTPGEGLPLLVAMTWKQALLLRGVTMLAEEIKLYAAGEPLRAVVNRAAVKV